MGIAINGVPQYMVLRKSTETFFLWQEKRYSVHAAPPAVFNEWIRQYVEEINDVDVAQWEIFHRWNVINDVLSKTSALTLEEAALIGTYNLRGRKPEDVPEEIKMSVSEIKSSAVVPELPASAEKGAEDS